MKYSQWNGTCCTLWICFRPPIAVTSQVSEFLTYLRIKHFWLTMLASASVFVSGWSLLLSASSADTNVGTTWGRLISQKIALVDDQNSERAYCTFFQRRLLDLFCSWLWFDIRRNAAESLNGRLDIERNEAFENGRHIAGTSAYHFLFHTVQKTARESVLYCPKTVWKISERTLRCTLAGSKVDWSLN